MPAKQPGVSGAYLNVVYGYDDAASEDVFEEHLYHRASVRRAGRLILYFRPMAHQMPSPRDAIAASAGFSSTTLQAIPKMSLQSILPVSSINGCRSARPHSGRAWASAEIPGDGGGLSRSVRNWSSLADLALASIAGTSLIEDHNILRSDLANRRRNRHDVDIRRYAP